MHPGYWETENNCVRQRHFQSLCLRAKSEEQNDSVWVLTPNWVMRLIYKLYFPLESVLFFSNWTHEKQSWASIKTEVGIKDQKSTNMVIRNVSKKKKKTDLIMKNSNLITKTFILVACWICNFKTKGPQLDNTQIKQMPINPVTILTCPGLGGGGTDTKSRQKSMTCIKAPEWTNDCGTRWCLSALWRSSHQ